jgi:hypothetical protein
MDGPLSIQRFREPQKMADCTEPVPLAGAVCLTRPARKEASMRHQILTCLAIGGLTSILSVPVAAGLQVKEAPKIGGIWRLNSQLSDPPGAGGQGDDGDKPVAGNGRRGGGMIPGGGVGGLGRGGGGGVPVGGQRGEGPGRGIDPEKLKAARALIEELMTAPVMLTIGDADGAVTFTEADGRTRSYKTDNRKEKHQVINATVETRARWEEGSLVIETDLGDGLKATQTYSVGADPRQLTVLTKLEGGPGRMSRQRPPRRTVYDDATPAAQP